jgi:heme transport system substrate-binding protein
MTSSPLRAAAGAFLLALMCVGIAAPAHAVTVTDGSGRKVDVADTSRIVSIGGDVTEILYALKADAKIVAVDSTGQFPADARKTKKVVGYMRALPAEGVLATNPTVILAAKDAGPPDVVALLKASSVPYVEVPDDLTPAGVAAKIRFVASIVGAEAAGDALAKDVECDYALLSQQRSKIGKPVRALFVLNVVDGRATAAGAHTSADAMLKLAGAVNAASGFDGYKLLTDEAAIELAPDAIVTMRNASPTFRSDQVLTVKGLQASPAGQHNRIIEMDGLYLLGFGPRSASAARDLMTSLYPSLAERRAGAGE